MGALDAIIGNATTRRSYYVLVVFVVILFSSLVLLKSNVALLRLDFTVASDKDEVVKRQLWRLFEQRFQEKQRSKEQDTIVIAH